MAVGSAEHEAWLQRQLDGPPSGSDTHASWLDRQLGTGELASPLQTSRAPTDSALGSAKHRAWIEAQLATRTGSSLRFSLEAPPATLPTAPPAALPPPPPHASSVFLSDPHPWASPSPRAAWLFARSSPPASTGSPSSPVRQPDMRLPGSVNAVLRGQDLSAHSHDEWLQQQIARAAATLDHGGSSVAPWPPEGGRSLVRNTQHDEQAHARWLEAQLAAPRAQILLNGPSSMPLPQAVQDCALGSRRHAQWLEGQLGERRRR